MTAMADASKPRWFSPTPGRLLAVLLAIEGFLWLCGWFQWIAKGWPVLIAVAAVGAFLLVMLGWFVLALLFHWRLPVQHPLPAGACGRRGPPVQLVGHGNETRKGTEGGGRGHQSRGRERRV